MKKKELQPREYINYNRPDRLDNDRGGGVNKQRVRVGGFLNETPIITPPPLVATQRKTKQKKKTKAK
jgi:hypothetical protein